MVLKPSSCAAATRRGGRGAGAGGSQLHPPRLKTIKIGKKPLLLHFIPQHCMSDPHRAGQRAAGAGQRQEGRQGGRHQGGILKHWGLRARCSPTLDLIKVIKPPRVLCHSLQTLCLQQEEAFPAVLRPVLALQCPKISQISPSALPEGQGRGCNPPASIITSPAARGVPPGRKPGGSEHSSPETPLLG